MRSKGPLRVFAIRDHYTEPHRKALTDILKPLWNTGTLEARRVTYGRLPDLFEVVSDPNDADIHLLTMKWQHYVDLGLTDQAVRAVETARKARRPIAVFSLGDFEANFPVEGRDIHLFQASAYASRRKTSNHGMPAFIADPLSNYGNGHVRLREKGPRPILGFCGQAGASTARHVARYIRNKIHRTRWRLGREQWEPPPLEHTWFRQQVLDAFSNSALVETRWVLRTRYRAGVHSADRNDPAQVARRAFLENVNDTDYTICVRGGGNFSIRFYEALAMGRSPVFVNTDCVLPYESRINWRDYAAWVEEPDLRDAATIVAKHHARLSPSEFRERQIECRRVWLDRLTTDGFYAHFHEHFPELD